jgi:ParB family transcriptional regulator, chromosome partitioning protein
MAMRKAARKPTKSAGTRTVAAARRATRRRLAPARTQRGLTAGEISLGLEHGDVRPLVELIRRADGVPIGAYRDPLGSRPLVLATLPLAAVQPTPFQRDLSPTHTKRLAAKIDEARAFLDPLIVVLGHDGRFWTPNGRHRHAAAKVLGLRQISVLVSPDEALAYRILALNTEKAHNLKDRSLEVIRMARTLAKREPRARESDFAGQFEAPELLTLGIIYQSAPRFAGGAYSPLLKKVDRFSDRTLAVSLREREGYADRLQAIDAEVQRIITGLQQRGFKSPYLRSYVVARINPVRFVKQQVSDTGPAMAMGQALTRMTAAAKAFKLDSVSNADLAWVAVGAGASE